MAMTKPSVRKYNAAFNKEFNKLKPKNVKDSLDYYQKPSVKKAVEKAHKNVKDRLGYSYSQAVKASKSKSKKPASGSQSGKGVKTPGSKKHYGNK